MFKPKKEGRLSRGCPNGGAQPQEWSVVGSGGIRNTPVIFGYFRSFESNRKTV